MVGVLHVDAELLQREHRLAAHVRAGVERRQVEVAAFVEHLGRAGVVEQEVLELGADVERVEAHRVRALQRAAQHVARVALIRRALGGDDVAEHPPHALLLRAPRQHRERARVGHRDHVGLLDRVEAGDRGAVEAHARLERVVELGALIENDFSCPRMSVNQKRMKRMSRSATSALTSSAVCGCSGIRLLGHRGGP